MDINKIQRQSMNIHGIYKIPEISLESSKCFYRSSRSALRCVVVLENSSKSMEIHEIHENRRKSMKSMEIHQIYGTPKASLESSKNGCSESIRKASQHRIIEPSSAGEVGGRGDSL
jgi:hypothetical protein